MEKAVSQQHRESGDQEGGKKFLPLAYVGKICDQAPVICFDGRAYRYEGGVYAQWYPEEIDQQIIQLYWPEVQTSHLHSVREFLTSVCFQRSEKVNPRGLLNLQNGLLSMQAGDFEPHSPDILSTVQSQTSFRPKDECPLWLRTVKEIQPNNEARLLLAQIFGYCLTPDNSHQKGFILHGDGANGKSLVK